jgi:hypothetical protein
VAAAPAAQVPLHDDHEVIANLWIRPDEALARHRAGAYDLMLPTRRSLEALVRFGSAAAVLDAVRAGETVPAILPKIVDGARGHRMLLPGDDGYDEAVSTTVPVAATFLTGGSHGA